MAKLASGWKAVHDTFTVSTAAVVRAATIGALYFVTVLALAPLSFHVFQFRAANVLKALAVCRPEFAFGFAIGNFFANQASPFGPLDWAVMPLFDIAAGLIAYMLRRWLWPAVVVQSAIIAAGVAVFPLGLGGGLPMIPTFLAVFASTALIIACGALTLLPAYRAAESRLR